MILELAPLYSEPSIQKLAKVGEVRWVEHVARMSDGNPAKLVFASDPSDVRECMRMWGAFEDGEMRP